MRLVSADFLVRIHVQEGLLVYHRQSYLSADLEVRVRRQYTQDRFQIINYPRRGKGARSQAVRFLTNCQLKAYGKLSYKC